MTFAERRRSIFQKLRKRIERGKKEAHIDNASLRAGSPMYYYCQLCRLLAAMFSESHTSAVPTHCQFCAGVLKDYGTKTVAEFLKQLKIRRTG